MKPKFSAPMPRDLRFERTQPEILKRVDFVLDESAFAASVADGFAVIICLIGAIALLGLFS